MHNFEEEADHLVRRFEQEEVVRWVAATSFIYKHARGLLVFAVLMVLVGMANSLVRPPTDQAIYTSIGLVYWGLVTMIVTTFRLSSERLAVVAVKVIFIVTLVPITLLGLAMIVVKLLA